MTPHEWLCEQEAEQSVLVDFLDQNLVGDNKLRLKITDNANSENNFEILEDIKTNSLMKLDFKVVFISFRKNFKNH